MKLNQPVTGREKPFTHGTIVTKTDLKGIDQQATTAQDIASGMETVNAMSEQNPSGVRRITEDARQLRGAAQALHELVAHVAAYPA